MGVGRATEAQWNPSIRTPLKYEDSSLNQDTVCGPNYIERFTKTTSEMR